MTVCIIMSTYNGEKYIGEQLDSILSQTADKDVTVYVRDDGSKDRTVEIIKEYANKNNDVSFEINEASNVGASGSFLSAIRECPAADIYAFCDQDDQWIDGKLDAAISALENITGPALWISDYSVVDNELNTIIEKAMVEPCLDQLKVLFFNTVPGCVMVFNRQLLTEIRKIRINEVRMHDIMTINTALITGKVIYDPRPFLKYRQHSANALGYANKKFILKGWLRYKLKLVREKEPYDTSEYAREVLTIWGDLLDDEIRKEYELISQYRRSVLKRMILLSRPYTKDKWGRTRISIRSKILLGLM